jgi:hypothetical protein
LNGARSGLHAGWGRSFNFSSWIIISMAAAAISGQILSWCKQLHLSAFLCIYFEEWVSTHLQAYSTILCTTVCLSLILVVFEDGPLEVWKQHQHYLAVIRNTSEFLDPLAMTCLHCMLHCLWQSIVGKPLLLLKIAAKIAWTFPYMPICKLLWHPPCMNFVIPNVLVDDGTCKSTFDIRLVGYIIDNNLCVLLNQCINSFNTVCHSRIFPAIGTSSFV